MFLFGLPLRAAAAALLALSLALSWSERSEARPLFGAALLGSALSGFTATNGTSALGLLALSHLQHKIDTLSQLAELFALGTNVTESFLVK